MIEIMQTVAGLFIFTLLVAPIVMLIILIARTTKPKTPVNGKKLEQLEQNDYNIVDDVNKAFHDVNHALSEINTNLNEFGKRLKDIEESLDRENTAVKGFIQKR